MQVVFLSLWPPCQALWLLVVSEQTSPGWAEMSLSALSELQERRPSGLFQEGVAEIRGLNGWGWRSGVRDPL